MTIYYSSSSNGFYDDSLITEYELSSSWPTDGVKITDVKYTSLLNGQSEGKVIAANNKGYPVLIEPPVPTQEDLTNEAARKKTELMNTASVAITPLQYAVDLGIASDEEAAQLKKWKRYFVLLNRIDTNAAPGIEWPEI